MIPVVNNNNYVNNQWFIMFPKLDFNFWCSISVCRWHGASLRSNLALKNPIVPPFQEVRFHHQNTDKSPGELVGEWLAGEVVDFFC